MHVAAQPIELCDGDGAFLAAGLFQRGGELRPAIEGIGSLSGFNLCEGGGDRKAVGGSEPSQGLLLRRQPKSGLGPCFCVLTR